MKNRWIFYANEDKQQQNRKKTEIICVFGTTQHFQSPPCAIQRRRKRTLAPCISQRCQPAFGVLMLFIRWISITAEWLLYTPILRFHRLPERPTCNARLRTSITHTMKSFNCSAWEKWMKHIAAVGARRRGCGSHQPRPFLSLINVCNFSNEMLIWEDLLEAA